MNLAQLREMLSEGIDDPAFIDQMILRIQAKQLPVHAPISGHVKPANDALPRRQKTHRERMEEGSAALSQAIAQARNGLTPKTPSGLIWLRESQASADYDAFTYEPPRFAARGPCAKCGVREDKHHEAGCARYARSVGC